MGCGASNSIAIASQGYGQGQSVDGGSASCGLDVTATTDHNDSHHGNFVVNNQPSSGMEVASNRPRGSTGGSKHTLPHSNREPSAYRLNISMLDDDGLMESLVDHSTSHHSTLDHSTSHTDRIDVQNMKGEHERSHSPSSDHKTAGLDAAAVGEQNTSECTFQRDLVVEEVASNSDQLCQPDTDTSSVTTHVTSHGVELPSGMPVGYSLSQCYAIQQLQFMLGFISQITAHPE